MNALVSSVTTGAATSPTARHSITPVLVAEEPHRLVTTERMSDVDMPSTQHEVILRADGERTIMTGTLTYATQEARDAAYASGWRRAWTPASIASKKWRSHLQLTPSPNSATVKAAPRRTSHPAGSCLRKRRAHVGLKL